MRRHEAPPIATPHEDGLQAELRRRMQGRRLRVAAPVDPRYADYPAPVTLGSAAQEVVRIPVDLLGREMWDRA